MCVACLHLASDLFGSYCCGLCFLLLDDACCFAELVAGVSAVVSLLMFVVVPFAAGILLLCLVSCLAAAPSLVLVQLFCTVCIVCAELALV